MPKPPIIFPKLEVPSNPPDRSTAASVMAQYSGFGRSPLAADSGSHHQIYRTKRKHVLKACDRCRVKKTKCDGNQPCYRCAAYNHPCLFRERKAMQTKAYSKGFVEMLESHHALVVKALQQLYTHCVNNKCFPGEPIDVVDGYPLTHAILDRMGLIKQAENEPEKLDTGSLGMPQFWNERRSSSTSVDSNELSPESPSEREVSASTSVPSSPDIEKFEPAKCQPQLMAMHGAYSAYTCGEQAWPASGQLAAPATVDVRHAMKATDYYAKRGPAVNRPTKSTNASDVPTCNMLLYEKHVDVATAGFIPRPENDSVYANLPQNPYQDMDSPFGNIGQHYSWNVGRWGQ